MNVKAFIIVAVLTALAGLPACSSSRDVRPTLKERMSYETVTGRLVKQDGDYYWLRDNDGREFRIYVDDDTKMDKVVPGDLVKAYIEKGPHATTVQRLDR
jgi:hypothetical protein